MGRINMTLLNAVGSFVNKAIVLLKVNLSSVHTPFSCVLIRVVTVIKTFLLQRSPLGRPSGNAVTLIRCRYFLALWNCLAWPSVILRCSFASYQTWKSSIEQDSLIDVWSARIFTHS